MNYNIEQIDIDKLHFDYKNPRLAEFDINVDTTEKEIVGILWDTMAVDEIVLSIAASGFFEHEPLIVVEETVKRQKEFIVIEGNRRLAAVKTILDQKLIEGIEAKFPDITISKQIRTKLKALPVIKVPSREHAWKFIGFKHINGPAKWGSFAKAQYISQIHKEFNISLSDIAAQIGDTNKTVEKLYQGLRVLEQAEDNKAFDRTDIYGSRLYFSHLYTALGYEGVKIYIGFDDSPKKIENPIAKSKIKETGEFLTWLFGSKKNNVAPVIRSQNPDLRQLDAVLKKPEAVRALKNGTALVRAYEVSQPNSELFENSLIEAKQALLKAHSYWSLGYNGNLEYLQVAGNIANLSESLYESMEKKHSALNNKKDKKRISE